LKTSAFKAEGTIRNYDYSLQELVHVGINLFNPEAFREKCRCSRNGLKLGNIA
jgi:hypothetical protein